MLAICEEFAKDNNIQFSTNKDPSKSKTKVMFMGPHHNQRTQKPLPLLLDGKPLPWVERVDHLGHVFTSNGQMEQDIEEKLAQFIDGSSKIRECFKFAHPGGQVSAIEKYCSSMYGSSLWCLKSKSVH